jgi:iron complex outermembrane receptor protein
MGNRASVCLGFASSVVYLCSASAWSADSAEDVTLQDVVVTATRREEAISKVPVSVTAFTPEMMEKASINGIDDIAHLAPGVAFFRGTYGTATISIRGVGDNSSSGGVGVGTTAIYVDDVPIQARSAPLAFTSTNPYPDTYDMQRVEVLRGPQGTLFGSGALGGAIRFITTQPSLTESSFKVTAEGADTEYGAPSYEGGFAAGVPLIEDVLGLRISAEDRHDGGWIDRIQRSDQAVLEHNANYADTREVRIALAFVPTANLKITPSFFAQERFANDEGLYWEGFSDPSTGHFADAGAAQPDHDRLDLGAIKTEYDMGAVMLTSDTSYTYRRNKNLYDVTSNVLEFTPAGTFPLLNTTQIPGLLNYTAQAFDLNQQNSFVQEFRLQSTNPDSRVTWQTGVFYQRMRSLAQDFQFTNPADFNKISEYLAGTDYQTLFYGIGDIPPNISYQSLENTLEKQTAVFGEINFKILDSLTATVGLRAAHISVDSLELQGGPYSYISTALTGSSNSTSENPVTPKFVLSYQADQNNLIYANVAKGYREGGVVHTLAPICDTSLHDLGFNSAPASYAPDKLWSYELGAKDLVFDKRLQLSSSVYQIDWKGIQQVTYLLSCGQALPFNGGSVQVRGFDFQADLRLSAGFQVNGTIAYTHSVYNQTLYGEANPVTGVRPVIINEGDSIGYPSPNSPAPWTATVMPEYDFQLGGHSGYGLFNYVFNSRHYIKSAAEDPATVQYLPSQIPTPALQYVDLRAGMHFGGLEAALFVKNTFDTHSAARTSYNNTFSNWYFDSTIRPRTVGIALTYRTK